MINFALPVRCGDIGEDQREYEMEPISVPATPQETPIETPAEPAKEPAHV